MALILPVKQTCQFLVASLPVGGSTLLVQPELGFCLKTLGKVRKWFQPHAMKVRAVYQLQ